MCCFFWASFAVRQPPQGGGQEELKAKIYDSTGKEVDDYQLEVDGEDFTFKFKKPHRQEAIAKAVAYWNTGRERYFFCYLDSYWLAHLLPVLLLDGGSAPPHRCNLLLWFLLVGTPLTLCSYWTAGLPPHIGPGRAGTRWSSPALVDPRPRTSWWIFWVRKLL